VLLHVRRDTVRLPNGATAISTSGIRRGDDLPILDSGSCMERQMPLSGRPELYELPPGRSIREATVETASGAPRGDRLRRPRWRYLTTIHPVVGYSTSASSCGSRAGSPPRRTARRRQFSRPSGGARDGAGMVRTGRISDAKTIVGVFWAEKIVAGAWPADSPS
jgi:ADP-ribose pyrophosphatase